MPGHLKAENILLPGGNRFYTTVRKGCSSTKGNRYINKLKDYQNINYLDSNVKGIQGTLTFYF